MGWQHTLRSWNGCQFESHLDRKRKNSRAAATLHRWSHMKFTVKGAQAWIPRFVAPRFTAPHRCAFYRLTARPFTSKKDCDSLYCGLELNPQYFWGLPIIHKPSPPIPRPFMGEWDQIAVCIYRRLLQDTGDGLQTGLVKVCKLWAKSGLRLRWNAELQHSSSVKLLFMVGTEQVQKGGISKITEFN